MKRFLYLLFVIMLLVAGSLQSWANPTKQARYITFRTVTSSSMEISFSSGNGTGRIVVVSPTDFTGVGDLPLDGTAYTRGATEFSYTSVGASAIGDGKVVFNSTQSTTPSLRQMTISGLEAGKIYWVAVFEFNNSPVANSYNRDLYNPPFSYDPPNNPRYTYMSPPAVVNSTADELSCEGFRAGWSDFGPDIYFDSYILQVMDGPDGTGNVVSGANGYPVDYDQVDCGTQIHQDVLDLIVKDNPNVYSYRVRAVKGYRFGDWSAWQNVSTMTPPCPSMIGSTSVCMNANERYSTRDNWLTYYWTATPDGTVDDQGTFAMVEWNTAGHKTVSAVVIDAYGNEGLIEQEVIVHDLPAVPPAIVSNSPQCYNIGVTLTREVPPADVTYYWETSATGTSTAHSQLNYTVNQSGTYYLRARNTFGCWSNGAASSVVVVNSLPVATAASTKPGYCVSTTIELLGSATGGLAPYTYAWTGPDGFVSNDQNPTIPLAQVANGGDYNLTVTDNATPNCVSEVSTVHVVVQPNPVIAATSNSPVCVDGTISLDVDITVGQPPYTYSWTGPNGFTSGDKNPEILNVLAANAGDYIVTVSDAYGCESNSTATVVVNPLPAFFVVNGGGAYCAGTTPTLVDVTLSGSELGADYLLFKNGAAQLPKLLGTGAALTWSNLDAGTYTIEAENMTTHCEVLMTGNAVIIENALPTQFAVGDGGEYCIGTTPTGVFVTLANSELDVNYQLLKGGVAEGLPIPGTGALLTWSDLTAGTYTVHAVNALTLCENDMTGSATVIENALPIQYVVAGGGAYCAGTTPTLVNVTLSNSELGVDYQLRKNNVNEGLPVEGNLDVLTWNNLTAGEYTVYAVNAQTGCVNMMTGSATVTENVLPVQYAVAGGGAYCAGTTPTLVNVTLANSELGVNYQLLKGGVAEGLPVAGTNALITWSNLTAGTYTVHAVNGTTLCGNTMTGSATVTENALPIQYAVAGGGAYCFGTNPTQVNVTLANSELGVNYQLLKGGVAEGLPVAGTNALLTWSNLTAGTYTVHAVNGTTLCGNTMTGSATVIENALPIQYAVAGGGAYCAGTTPTLVNVTLANSELGVNYQLLKGGVVEGLPVPGTNALITWSNLTAGTYTVQAVNGTTLCENTMTGSATVTENALPIQYAVAGGGAYCFGTNPTLVNVTLANSELGVNYQLLKGGVAEGLPVAGTNALITWSNLTAGTYTVHAVNGTTLCGNTMTGSATVTENALPIQYAVAGGGAYCIGTTPTLVNVTLANSQVGVNYQLLKGGIAEGLPVAGTNALLTWSNLTAGIYTVHAVNGSTLCANTMTGSATVIEHALPTQYAVAGGGGYCLGTTPTLVNVTLANSELGANYQLLKGGVAEGLPVAGTGALLTWSNLTAGTYTVHAVYTATLCGVAMTGQAVIVEHPIPTAITITGPTTAMGNQQYVYSVENHAGSTYNWTIPVGATFVGASTGNAVTVLFAQNSGDITVQEVSQFGCFGTKVNLYVNVISGPPVDQATYIRFPQDGGNNIDVCWTNGSGNRRLIAMSTSDPSNWVFAPVNNNDYTNRVNTDFSLAPDVDPGSAVVKLVYQGPGSCTNITGILANTVYYFKVYEFNESGLGVKYYNTTNAAVNPTQVKKLSIDNLGTKSSNVNFSDLTIRVKNRAGNAFTVTSPVTVTVGMEQGTGTLINNIATFNNTTFIVMSAFRWRNPDGVISAKLNAVASDGSYMTALSNVFILKPERPTIQAYNVVVSDPATNPSTSRLVTWTRGNGSQCLVVGRRGNTPASPVDYNSYIADSYFGGGNQIGGATPPSYTVYKGTGTEVTVTNLECNRLYFFKVFEFNGVEGSIANMIYANTGGANNPNSAFTAPCGSPRLDQGMYVELASFIARSHSNKALVSWRTSFEQQVAGFELLRADFSQEDAEFVKIGSFESLDELSAVNTNSGKVYGFVDSDENLKVGKEYKYMLVAVGFDGERIEIGLTNVTILSQTGESIALYVSPVVPNPVKDQMNFSMELSSKQNVTIEIMDLSGRRIATPVYGQSFDAGIHPMMIPFNEDVASGMYIMNVTAGTETITTKFMFVK